MRTRKLYGRVSRHRDGLAEPRSHLAPELYVIAQRGDTQQEVGWVLSVLRNAIVTAEKISGHVKLAKLDVLCAVVEHVGETAIGPENLGVGTGKLRDEIEHNVTFRGTQAREAHTGQCTQVLPGDSPGPLALNLVHFLQLV